MATGSYGPYCYLKTMSLKSCAAKHGRHPLAAHPVQGMIWAADCSGGLAVLHLFQCIETCCSGTHCCVLDINTALPTFQILSRLCKLRDSDEDTSPVRSSRVGQAERYQTRLIRTNGGGCRRPRLAPRGKPGPAHLLPRLL